MGIIDQMGRAGGLEFQKHSDAVRYLVAEYDREIASGNKLPFTYPIGALGGVMLVLYLLLPPNSRFDSKPLRRSVFLAIAAIHTWLMYHCKSFSPAIGFGIGILMSWGTVWSAVLLVFHNAKVDFKRLQMRKIEKTVPEDEKSVPSGALHGVPKEGSGVVQRKTANGSSASGSATETIVRTEKKQLQKQYYWQAYPSDASLIRRLDWALDLSTNFRGSIWNWRVSGLPSLPAHVQRDLGIPEDQIKDKAMSWTGVPRFDDWWAVITHNGYLFFKCYYGIDLIKTIMSHDPFFWGLTSRPPPEYYPWWIKDYPFMVNSYRQFVSMCMVWLGLRLVFTLGPLFFVFYFKPEQIGANAEPWAYPDHFGSYWQVFDRGLAGWWGGWWHQTFRYAFQSAGDYFIRKTGIKPKTLLGKTVGMVVAFTLSGILHARGSITMMGETSPWMGSFMFFFLQPIGITIETFWIKGLKRVGLYDKTPKWLGVVANVIYAHAWFYLTAPLLVNDFANGGLWLFEPFPISTFRGLGFGPKGGCGWWPWGTDMVRWHSDKWGRWWLSGIAI